MKGQSPAELGLMKINRRVSTCIVVDKGKLKGKG